MILFVYTGGAERLVVDAAVGLQELGHYVTIYTSHFDKKRAFPETTDGKLKIKVLGDGIVPRNFHGKFSIVCAMLRQLHLIFALLNTKEGQAYDLFVVDQLSICIPFIREYAPNSRILFYGHFPDKLLADHESILKKIYRFPFDVLEQWSTSQSDVIIVNSKFTRSVFEKEFPKIQKELGVAYPCVNTKPTTYEHSPFAPYSFVLSINRFEKKKNVELAVNAFTLALKQAPPEEAGKHKLILAGGYDPRVQENLEYMAQLQMLCKKNQLSYVVVWPTDGPSAYNTRDVQSKNVVFIPSVSHNIKQSLLADAALLAYTPSNEHFGIVPLEAMFAGTPVIATNTGGPLETITSETGWLLPPDADKWAEIFAYSLFSISPEERLRFQENGRKRVLENFSEIQMARQFEKYGQLAIATQRKKDFSLKLLEIVIISLMVILVFGTFTIYSRPRRSPNIA